VTNDARFIIRMVPNEILLECLQVFPYIDHLIIGIPDKSSLLHHVSSRQSSLKCEKNDTSQMLAPDTFFLFHSRDYYKLSLYIIFNTFDNLWKSQEHMPSDVCSIKLQYNQVHKSCVLQTHAVQKISAGSKISRNTGQSILGDLIKRNDMYIDMCSIKSFVHICVYNA